MTTSINKYMIIIYNKKTPTKNFIGIRKSLSSDPIYTASVLITIFDLIHKLNPRCWQRMNSESYKILTEACESDVYVKNTINEDDFLYLTDSKRFYVSSIMTCVLLGNYIHGRYNHRPRIIPSHIDNVTKRYLSDIIR